ncbi:hypothetical protein ACH4D4_30315 [Streptomyces pristinaespiralis]|uniref:hypothetical protein n=1 Tax=Streptomyces pristinaespiralis TaxID=38300 RepID=UPI003794E264
MALHLRDEEMSLRDIAKRLVITPGAKNGSTPRPQPSCGSCANTTSRLPWRQARDHALLCGWCLRTPGPDAAARRDLDLSAIHRFAALGAVGELALEPVVAFGAGCPAPGRSA